MIHEDQKKYNLTTMKYAATEALNTNTKRCYYDILNECFYVNNLPHAKYSTENCLTNGMDYPIVGVSEVAVYL